MTTGRHSKAPTVADTLEFPSPIDKEAGWWSRNWTAVVGATGASVVAGAGALLLVLTSGPAPSPPMSIVPGGSSIPTTPVFESIFNSTPPYAPPSTGTETTTSAPASSTTVATSVPVAQAPQVPASEPSVLDSESTSPDPPETPACATINPDDPDPACLDDTVYTPCLLVGVPVCPPDDESATEEETASGASS